MPAKVPHGFNKEELPWIKLTPYLDGAAGVSTVTTALNKVKDLVNELKKDSKTDQSIGSKLNLINEKYYGITPDNKNQVYIPITESFKMSAENEFETVDPMSSFSGAFGGAGTMVGANIMGINNVVGKFWAGSNIGIGNFQYSVAVDTTMEMQSIADAVKKNREYVQLLKDLFFVSRSPGDIGVLTPPKFCNLTSSWGFSRKYVGVKSLNIETFGMWDSDRSPISYNITIEVEDCVLGLEDKGAQNKV